MKTEKWPVLFRIERDGTQKSVVAVLPYNDANFGHLVCYAHIGQHAEGSLEWYQGTKPAKPAEYAELLSELRCIYEDGDDAVDLVVKQRLPSNWRDHAWRMA